MVLHEITQQNLAEIVAHRTGAERYSQTQFYLSECPYCGNSNHSHVSSLFGQTSVGVFFKCFACGKATSIYSLGIHLGVLDRKEIKEEEVIPVSPIVFDTQEKPDWWNNRYTLLEEYTKNSSVFSEWAKYKGIRPDEVQKYNLGYGCLPNTTIPRLIIPVFDGEDNLIGFRGRLVDKPTGNQVKWLSTKGLSVSKLDVPPFYKYAREYSHLIIVENMVDAILINERTNYCAIPTMSVTYWNDDWYKRIDELNPISIIVAYDKDLAGNGISKDSIKPHLEKRLSKMGILFDEVTGCKITKDNILVRYVDYEDKTQIAKIPSPYGYRLYLNLKQKIKSSFIHLGDWREIEGNDIGDTMVKR